MSNPQLGAVSMGNAAAVAHALDILRHRRGNLFLTGRAGTGKTTFLERARTDLEAEERKVAVVAFSGMAAVQSRGTTINSFFRIKPQAYHPEGPELTHEFDSRFASTPDHRDLLRALDLLFIDEVSMVRADLLDVIDVILRRVRGFDLPFGGVQVCLIGDAFQLPPVVTDQAERHLLIDAYDDNYAFYGARVFKRSEWHAVELPEVMRQRGGRFVEILNRIRIGEQTDADLAELNERVTPPYALGFLGDDQILVTTHNARVAERNRNAIQQLETPSVVFSAEVEGKFYSSDFPTDEQLELKVGALVMFVRNDADSRRRYHNGTLGVVTEIGEQVVRVSTRSGVQVTVSREQWEKIKYNYRPGRRQLEVDVIGTFRQLPLKLAYAITVHKCQGLSLDEATVDVTQAFDTGQTYVALSRLRTVEGLYLQTPLTHQSVRVSAKAIAFQRWVDEQSGAAFAKTTGSSAAGFSPKLTPRFPRPQPPSGRESGQAVRVSHSTDSDRKRSRAELEMEIEQLRRQRDELLRVVRKMSKVLAAIDL